MGGAERMLFRFKQFAVRHDRSLFKVGTDAVLLGAWASASAAAAVDARCPTMTTTTTNTTNVLDIGTGCGIIALMMAQRTTSNTQIHAVELDEQSCHDAQENFQSSPWSQRLQLYQSDIRQFAQQEPYHFITCNPPYFKAAQKQRKATRPQRCHLGPKYNSARHAIHLNHDDLLQALLKLLHPTTGTACLIFPKIQGQDFIQQATTTTTKQQNDTSLLHLTRQLTVVTRDGNNNAKERLLIQLSRQEQPPPSTTDQLLQQKLIIRDEHYEYTPDFIQLTKDFYRYH